MTTGKDDPTAIEHTEAFEALTMRDNGIGRVELAQVGATPIDVPRPHQATLGGALATNSHSRTSATYGGFFADRVPDARNGLNLPAAALAPRRWLR